MFIYVEKVKETYEKATEVGAASIMEVMEEDGGHIVVS